jgi:hypothetical protein
MSDSNLKIEKLTGSSNWDIWAIRMEAVLIEKGYYDVMTTDPNSASVLDIADDARRQYTSLSLKATAQIRLSLGNGPLIQTKAITNPYLLWATLKRLYESKGFSSEFLICKELFNLKLGKSSNLEAYLAKIRQLTDELASRDLTIPKKVIIAYTLNNLTSDFENTVAIISQGIRESSNENIELEKVFAYLIDESKRLKSISNTSLSEQALNTSNNAIICGYCNRKGHTEEKCWKKHPALMPDNIKARIKASKPNKPKKYKKANNTIATKENGSENSDSDTEIALVSIVMPKNQKIDPVKKDIKTANISLPKYDISKDYLDPNWPISKWVLDSGASAHICSNKRYFDTLGPVNCSIKWGNSTGSIKASGIGDITLKFEGYYKNTAILKNVLYVPEIGVNLLSLGLIKDRNYTVLFNKDNITIQYSKSGRELASGKYTRNISIFNAYIKPNIENPKESRKPAILLNSLVKIDPENMPIIAENKLYNANNTSINKNTSISDIVELWHKRLGHIGSSTIEKLLDTVEGIDLSEIKLNKSLFKSKTCPICLEAKLTSKVSKKPSTKASYYFEKVASDIGGPIFPSTNKGSRYYVLLIDSYTRYIHVELLSNKSDISTIIPTIIKFEEKASGKKLITFFSDNAKEYKALDASYFDNRGIKHNYSAPYSHEQNGLVERPNRTLFNKVRALLFQANLAKKYWGEALIASVYLYNRTPHKGIDYKTPYELRYGDKPNIANIAIWGSLAYKKEPKELAKSLSKRAQPYYVIGYGSNQYKLLDPSTTHTMWARDVEIIEGVFWGSENNQNRLLINLNDDLDDSDNNSDISDSIEDTTDSIDTIAPKSNKEASPNKETQPLLEENNFERFWNQVNEYAALNTSSIINPIEPQSYKAATASSNYREWYKAMKSEMEDLNKLNTWTLIPRPKNESIVSGKWVYKLKINPDNTIDKYKARYVARGFSQQYGVNYNETFANTARLDIIRSLFAISTIKNLYIRQWDIRLAFPNSPIDTDIYVEQPEGFKITGKESYVYKLNKALYGLKQSARQWQLYLAKLLAELGLVPSKIDPSVYTGMINGSNIVIITYVDDMLIFSDNIEHINDLYKRLATKVDIKDLGDAKYFIGIEIDRKWDKKEPKNSYIFIYQKAFINKLLAKFNKENIKPRTSPNIIGVKLAKNPNIAPLSDIKSYQQQIGSLIYLCTCTRAELAYPIGLLARFMANPSLDHFKALDIVWGYLKTTVDLGILYKSTSLSNSNITPIRLEGESDSDWGGDYDTRRSTTGWVYTLNSSAIAWNSKLQKTVALSSCEAEYMALKEAIKESLYLNAIYTSIPLLSDISDTNKVYTDSQSAMELAKNPIHHARTKHIDIQYHFIRENVINGIIDLVYKNTSQLRADGFTKALPGPKFNQIVTGLGLVRKSTL